jgi:polyphosphate kinase 2 (PPK2 family)
LGLLIIFQGVDTAGIDGTVRHVMSCMNPMGVNVKSFKKPTTEELQHDFLWRVYPHFPTKGMIEVFNRSYYAQILVPSLADTISKDTIQHRYQMLDDLEEHLELNNLHVLKFFLPTSKNEQHKRIKERLTKPHKRWKYTIEDTKAAA